MSSASVMYPTGFLLMINGQIETAQFFNASDIYCKYCFVHGPDWNVLSGIEEGLSQMCCRSSLENSADGFVLNFPVELTLKSTNPYGCKLVLSCYGTDWFGNDVIRGYGFTHIPTSAGRHVREVAMFVPKASSKFKHFLSWLVGRRPEFVDPTFIAQAESRDCKSIEFKVWKLTQVEMSGMVKISLNVVSKCLKKLGYDCCRRTQPLLSDFPWKQVQSSATAAPFSTTVQMTTLASTSEQQNTTAPGSSGLQKAVVVEKTDPSDNVIVLKDAVQNINLSE
ncbi:B9 domain-containing protein 1 [Trichinella nelsoni]|uniref:B9 domain-containing protein 1 n=1 Tax=Trichinella nelsoni TaxID=6336 RepID=A0A0V0S4I9_9BILA|nr:B9 domain-containing protein 1 [Trichinella nelsoni]